MMRLKSEVLAGESNLLLNDLHFRFDVKPHEVEQDYRGRRPQRHGKDAIHRLYMKGENLVFQPQLYPRLTNNYSLTKDRLVEGNATKIL